MSRPFATSVLVLGLCACTSAPESAPAADALAADAPDVVESAAPAAAKPEVETLVFEAEIAAPVEEIWHAMLGPESYPEWTKPFLEGCYFEGSWAQGERMHFLAPGGSGMVAVIAECRPYEVVSIRHIGYVMNGVEDTTSEDVRSWAPAHETYRFAEVAGGTKVTIEHEVLPSMEAYMRDVWPRALAALESLCEGD